MEVVDSRTDLRILARELKRPVQDSETWGAVEGSYDDGEGWSLLDVVLAGGAPWGFTLRGGREHQEPLLITKVEEGSKAEAFRLQVGDEIVGISGVSLSGYRQEAICLVKSSFKTLALVVRRGNDPACRPHSWHSSNLSEKQPEAPKTQPAPVPAPVWQTKYDASSFSNDLSNCWDQTNLRQVSGQFISVGDMDSLEHPSHPYPHGRLSPTKSVNSTDHSAGGGGGGLGKHESTHGSFSTGSGTPDHSLSRSNAASTECVFYRASPGELGGQTERPRYLQLPMGNGGRVSPRMEEQAGSRCSSSGRLSVGPVWHVPEKKSSSAAPSPPPPPPPLRSDSFAATKVHEKGLVTSYSESPAAYSQQKPRDRGMDRPFEATENFQRGHHTSERGPEARRSYNPPPMKDLLHVPAEDYNPNQLNPNKLYSLSSTDVRQGQSPYACVPHHPRQHSDESPFYLHPGTPSAPKTQSVGNYYRSLQDLPTNACGRGQTRASTASLSSTALDQTSDCGGHIRYYCITARQPAPGKVAEGRRANSDVACGASDRSSVSSQTAVKAKYPLPHPPYHDGKSRNGYCKQANGQPPVSEAVPAVRNALMVKPSSEERERRKEGGSAETHVTRYLLSQHGEQRNRAAAPQRDSQLTDPWVSQEERKICAQKTPMLHSLSQERKSLPEEHLYEKNPVLSSGNDLHEALDPSSGKPVRRSDRYATKLRNEIQLKRAQLQKSRSAATLTCPSEAEEDAEVWRSAETSTSSSDGSFTNTYKDHLKEAQARVLQATSYRRRDLELPGNDALSGHLFSSLARKDPSASETFLGKPGPVSRIGGRKRFPTVKKVHSFSEPEKINEVGVEEEVSRLEAVWSFVDCRKFFEGASRPAFSKPVLKHPPQNSYEDQSGGKARGIPTGESEGCCNRDTHSEQHLGANQGEPSLSHGPDLLEQQRLGTFAEYEATWNMQRKQTDGRTSGRYHSAENILDSEVEERNKSVRVHERSRSSPSADFYGQKIPLPVRKSAEYSHPDHEPGEQRRHITSSPERGHSDCGVWETPAQPQHFPQPAESTARNVPESRDVAAPVPSDHRHKPAPQLPPYPQPCLHGAASEQPSLPRKKGPAPPQRPALPELDKPARLETTSSQESFQAASQAAPAERARSPGTSSSLGRTSSSLGPAPAQDRDPGPESRLEDEWREASRTVLSIIEPFPPPPPPPPRLCPSTSSSPSYRNAGLIVPSTNGMRSPSPQFAPQRLTDKPPASVQDEAKSSSTMDSVAESGSAVKKVPVRIVHAESSQERASRQYLLRSEAPGGCEGSAAPPPNRLGSPEQPHSLFCAYTRQGPETARDASPPGRRTHAGAAAYDASWSNGVSGASQRSEEDLKREELARDIMGKDKSLADILDQSKMKTTMDLMEGLFPQGEELLEGAQQRRKAAPKQASPRSSEERRAEDSLATAASLVTSSSYYSTSAPKAELLIKMKDMQDQMEEQDSEDELDYDLSNKKQALIDSLTGKLQVLREVRESLAEDVQDNNALGDEVEAVVQAVCKPNELDKFRMFVGDLDKVVSLLLSLSARLARVENALNGLEEGASPGEKHTLTEKRKLLIRQHEDAKELKENLDRRERLVFHILAGCLSDERLADYEHFVKMKSALIIEQRKLEDKIKLGEEQLKCLKDSLPLEQRVFF